jgi:hypothetical protein
MRLRAPPLQTPAGARVRTTHPICPVLDLEWPESWGPALRGVTGGRLGRGTLGGCRRAAASQRLLFSSDHLTDTPSP